MNYYVTLDTAGKGGTKCWRLRSINTNRDGTEHYSNSDTGVVCDESRKLLIGENSVRPGEKYSVKSGNQILGTVRIGEKFAYRQSNKDTQDRVGYYVKFKAANHTKREVNIKKNTNEKLDGGRDHIITERGDEKIQAKIGVTDEMAAKLSSIQQKGEGDEKAGEDILISKNETYYVVASKKTRYWTLSNSKGKLGYLSATSTKEAKDLGNMEPIPISTDLDEETTYYYGSAKTRNLYSFKLKKIGTSKSKDGVEGKPIYIINGKIKFEIYGEAENEKEAASQAVIDKINRLSLNISALENDEGGFDDVAICWSGNIRGLDDKLPGYGNAWLVIGYSGSKSETNLFDKKKGIQGVLTDENDKIMDDKDKPPEVGKTYHYITKRVVYDLKVSGIMESALSGKGYYVAGTHDSDEVDEDGDKIEVSDITRVNNSGKRTIKPNPLKANFAPAPPPPPAAPSGSPVSSISGGQGGDRAGMLNQIRQGMKLKKAETNDRSAPVTKTGANTATNETTGQKGLLNDILAGGKPLKKTVVNEKSSPATEGDKNLNADSSDEPSILEQIRKGMKLRKTETNDKSAPAIGKNTKSEAEVKSPVPAEMQLQPVHEEGAVTIAKKTPEGSSKTPPEAPPRPKVASHTPEGDIEVQNRFNELFAVAKEKGVDITKRGLGDVAEETDLQVIQSNIAGLGYALLEHNKHDKDSAYTNKWELMASRVNARIARYSDGYDVDMKEWEALKKAYNKELDAIERELSGVVARGTHALKKGAKKGFSFIKELFVSKAHKKTVRTCFQDAGKYFVKQSGGFVFDYKELLRDFKPMNKELPEWYKAMGKSLSSNTSEDRYEEIKRTLAIVLVSMMGLQSSELVIDAAEGFKKGVSGNIIIGEEVEKSVVLKSKDIGDMCVKIQRAKGDKAVNGVIRKECMSLGIMDDVDSYNKLVTAMKNNKMEFSLSEKDLENK